MPAHPHSTATALHQEQLPIWLRYGGAVLCVACALLITVAVPGFRTGAPLLFFVFAIAISGLYGGVGPAILALAVSTVCAMIWVLPPLNPAQVTVTEFPQIAAFIVASLLTLLLVYTLRKTQSRLYAERESLRITLASIGDGVIATDATGHITWMNAVATDLTGWDATEALGKPVDAVFSMLPVTDGLAGESNHLTVLQHCMLRSSGTTVLSARDGTQLQITFTAAPIRGAQDQVTGSVLVFRDTTERQRVQAALHASEERYRVAQELSLDAFTILHAVRDESGTIIDFQWDYVNPAAASILGHSRQELEGQQLLKFLPGNKDSSELFERYVAVTETGLPHDIEIAYNADNIHGWFRNMAVRLGDGVAVSFYDITDRKRYESQLSYQAFLLDNVSDAVIAIDNKGCITAWNHGAESLYGWTAQEVIGRNGAEAVQSELSTGQRLATLAVVDAKGRGTTDVIHHNRAGEVLYIESVMSALHDESGNTIGYVVINRDMSERRRHEEELVALNASLEERVRERTAELERSNRELDQFAYVASHDLKAPLRAIAVLANWISDDAKPVLPPASVLHLSKLIGRVRRMESLLEDLLAYSRAGRLRQEPELVNTRQLVRDIVDYLALPASFSVATSEVMPTFFTERIPLETVFRNLIDNAYKHHDHPERGAILITTTETPDAITFSFKDDGPGIPPEYHERVFMIFQTLRPRDEVEGSGMGLTIVKKIVESRGGSIALDSTPGQGATFCVRWPRHTR